MDLNVQAAGGNETAQFSDAVFGAAYNEALIHQVVTAYMAAARSGTKAQKTRSEVSGGGAKPFKQKGTGRARQGSSRAPQYTGGGVVHGPTPRDYEQRTPKKMKAAALRGALSDRARNGRVHVISAVVDGDIPSTKGATATIAAITDRRNVLVVVERDDVLGWKSLRNVVGVHLLVADQHPPLLRRGLGLRGGDRRKRRDEEQRPAPAGHVGLPAPRTFRHASRARMGPGAA